MSFIRTKKIKGFEYAYIVENRWAWKKTKQKSKKYLGRVFRPGRANMMDFFEFYNIENAEKYLNEHTKEEIVEDLIRLELFNHGFVEKEDVFEREGHFFSMEEKKAYNSKGNDVAIACNEGFLTTYAVRRILNFNPEYEEEGYDLAKMFVEAGISIPQEIFVGIFGKIFK